ncbi:MAG TPA: DUF2993 domain-containing protein [Mycobacteriales bacterium]
MLKGLVITLGLTVGLGAAADRGLAEVAANATADQIKLHEGVNDVDVTFRGFPFVTQAVRGEFTAVDVTARDVKREGLTVDRIDAHLEGVEVDLGDALNGRVSAIPVEEGHATVRVTYGDLQSFLASKPGNIRLVTKAGAVVVVTTFGIPGIGAVEVEGTPKVSVSGSTIRVSVSNAHTVDGRGGLTATLAAQAAARASFTVPLGKLPFGIKAASAELTDEALVVQATAQGIVVDVNG